MTTDEFKDRVKAVHKNRYNLDYTEYVNRRTNVKVICKIHGSFYARSTILLNGGGCKKNVDM